MADFSHIFDVLIVGGGINGAGIAADAAGRGLHVLLCEKDDLGASTSSASSKMIHGGLRYLEHYEFRLVREALSEREVLHKKAPHLIRPLRLLLPHTNMARPAWMVRLGLFIYDHLSSRQTLPGCESIRLGAHPAGRILAEDITKAFAYSDCRVDDSRLVIANAMAANNLGADICPRHKVLHAERRINRWHVTIRNVETGEIINAVSRTLINAVGPEVETFLHRAMRKPAQTRVRLVKGSHIVVPAVYGGPEAFLFQHTDGRVIFVIPFEGRYSLIGTTDVPVDSPRDAVAISPDETAYLCDAVNRYLRKSISADDVVWSFAGVRPLFDDGSDTPSSVTRDYTLELDAPETGAPLLSVFGGKITTYRCLAESVMARIAPFFPGFGPAWTEASPLPGGDIGAGTFDAFRDGLHTSYPGIDPQIIDALADRHGGNTEAVLGDARVSEDLGEHFGDGLTAHEIDHMLAHEWARTAEDILWRRTKAGLHLDQEARHALQSHLDTCASKAA